MTPFSIGLDVWVVILGQAAFLVGLLYWVRRKNREDRRTAPEPK